MNLTNSDKMIFGYKTASGKIVSQLEDAMVWNDRHETFVKKIKFDLIPGEKIVKTGFVILNRWFWTPQNYQVPSKVPRLKDGSVDVDNLPTFEVTFDWAPFSGTVSEPRTTGYQVPHGPDEPCTCTGCGFCDGFEDDCTCDIDWEAMREAREEAWLNDQFQN